jgi:hypothetical protein
MRNIVTVLILLSWVLCVAGCEKNIEEVEAPMGDPVCAASGLPVR